MQGLRMTLRSLLSRDRAEKEMDQELRFHIQMQTELNIRKGMTPEQARTQALREFGGVEKFKEQCREERGGRWLEQLLQDLRFGLRTLLKNPGYSAVVILILALGIGANTAIFSAVHGILLRPLPYPQEDRLVILRQSARRPRSRARIRRPCSRREGTGAVPAGSAAGACGPGTS